MDEPRTVGYVVIAAFLGGIVAMGVAYLLPWPLDMLVLIAALLTAKLWAESLE